MNGTTARGFDSSSRRIAVTMATLLAALTLTGAHAQGLLENGDFQAGDAGWQIDEAGRALYSFIDDDGLGAPGAVRYSAEEAVRTSSTSMS